MTEIQNIMQSATKALGFEFVGYERLQEGNVFRIYIDKPGGVTLEDCTKTSRQISAAFEVEDAIKQAYRLEVSSPGLDRPLYTLDHYNQFVGRDAKIKLHSPLGDRKNFAGKIKVVTGETITLIAEDGEYELTFGNIKKANLIPELAKKRLSA